MTNKEMAAIATAMKAAGFTPEEVARALGVQPAPATGKGGKKSAPGKASSKTESWTKKDGTEIKVTKKSKDFLEARRDYLDNRTERTPEAKAAEKAEFDRLWAIWQAGGQQATKKGTEARKQANSAETKRIWAEIRKNRK